MKYDGLNLALEKRYSHNFSGRVSYAIGKARGNVNGGLPDTANFQFLDDLNLDMNEGPTGSDRTHNFVVSFRGMVPKTGGLTVSGVYRALSGTPLTIQDTNFDPDRNGILFDPLPAGTYSGTGANAITVENDGGRNGARGPGFTQFDMRIGYRLRRERHANARHLWRDLQRHQSRQLRQSDRRSPLGTVPGADDVARRRIPEAVPARRTPGLLNASTGLVTTPLAWSRRRWITAGPFRQPAVQAPSCERPVLPVHAPWPVIEAAKERLTASRAAEIECPVAERGKHDEHGERGQRNHGRVVS